MGARYIVGDALTELRKLPDDSVDLVMTSPPFLALRSYLPADDPNKAKEMGSESTPGEYLDVLLDVVVECRRVLAPHGSIVVELGDTYAGSNQVEGRGKFANGYSAGGFTGNAGDDATAPGRHTGGDGWPLDKSLTMIPESFAFALAYGRNPWTGRTLEPWRVRNIVAWCRPNPPVGALGDKFRPATSYLTVACTTRDRYFDLDAVRHEHNPNNHRAARDLETINVGHDTGSRGDDGQPFYNLGNPAGAPPLDYWVIPTAPYKGAHYATFPPQLVVRPVKAMCPRRVCRVCGEPSRRIVSDPEYVAARQAFTEETMPGAGRGGFPNAAHPWEADRANTQQRGLSGTKAPAWKHQETLGWTDCGCCDDGRERPARYCRDDDHWRPGVVLDPFAGSGTTLEVATGHGRDAIGIDLDVRNAEFAQQRCGMFLTVEEVA